MKELEHNYPTSVPEVFPSNHTFLQADITIIKDDIKAHIPPIKTLARLHNLNTGKYFTIQDFVDVKRLYSS